MDLYASGLDVLDELDSEHIKRCPDCHEEYSRSVQFRKLLTGYADSVDLEFRSLERREYLLRELRPATGRKPALRWWKWGAVAASLVASFLLGHWLTLPPEPRSAAGGMLVDAIVAESAREEIVLYVGKTQLFLLTLLENSGECSIDDEVKREMARRLLYQKHLLQPKLAEERYRDIRKLLDELDVLLLDVADGEGCFRTEESELWKGILSTRPTLVKLDLLQVKERI